MEIKFRNFEFHFLEKIERYLKLPFPVTNIGYLPKKRQWIDTEDATTCSFGIILSGEGFMRAGDKKWKMNAPCVYCNQALPGIEYGPVGVWEEFFWSYDLSLTNSLLESACIRKDQPVWQIHNSVQIQKILEDINICLQDIYQYGKVDRLDRLCEMLLVESILSTTSMIPDDTFRIIQQVKQDISRNYLESPNLNKIAKKYNISSSSFRRAWLKYYKLPPKQYAIQLRINAACRMLEETHMQIQEIADALKFRDIYYFSRLFKKKMNMSAMKYRTRYRFYTSSK